MRFKKVYIEITNICNLSCNFCSKTNRKLKEMSIEEFKKTITQVKKVTEYVYLHIKGEPLLHTNINEIVRICKDNNIFVNLTTNGTLIEKNKEIFKKENNFRQVNISLHSYNSKEKLKELFTTIDEIRKTNKKTYFVYRFWTIDTNAKEYLELISILKKFYNYEFGNKIDDRLFFSKDIEFTWPSLNEKFYEENGKCYGLKTHIGILSDGTVVPCCLDCEGIIDLGNIFNEDINEILNKKRTQIIIDGFNNNKKIEELCRHCSFKM